MWSMSKTWNTKCHATRLLDDYWWKRTWSLSCKLLSTSALQPPRLLLRGYRHPSHWSNNGLFRPSKIYLPSSRIRLWRPTSKEKSPITPAIMLHHLKLTTPKARRYTMGFLTMYLKIAWPGVSSSISFLLQTDKATYRISTEATRTTFF